jgi:glycosyltransferase involved in cell wall biosynthesis
MTVRLLFLCHAHPDLQAGGTEIFARDLFRTLRRDFGAEGLFLAGTFAGQRPRSPGTPFQTVGGAPDEVLLWTAGFDPFFQSQIDLHGVMPELATLLRELRPDVVHIHHLMTLGVEVVGLVRRVLPHARMVKTLHDYYALCPRDGQMVTTSGTLCQTPSVDSCRLCFPDRGLTDVRLRRLHVDTALDQIDRFIAPSRFLRDRFVANGMDPARITVLANGIPEANPTPHREAADGRRDRFGFFGHINRFKGATVALAASARLSKAGVAHTLALHGSAAHQTADFADTFATALAAAPDARHVGPYARADLARRMAGVDWVVVPSVWWENAPLVIMEAFQHRRPVICSDIGGMAEAVRDGVDGLHAPVDDAGGLAETMRRAIETPGLWQRLVEGITPPVAITAAAAAHHEFYRGLLAAGARRAA